MRTLIKNVNIFDGHNSELRRNASIVIDDNIVYEICKGEVSEDCFDMVIDGAGRTAMPGMVESHVHLGFLFGGASSVSTIDFDTAVSAAVARKLLYNGFTTVRDASGIVQGLKKAFDLNVLEGPRIYPSNSCLTQTCGHGDMYDHTIRELQYRVPTFSVLVDGVDEVRRGVREQFYKGASQIKIMAGGGCSSEHDPIQTLQFSFDEMKAAVDAAKDYGTYVMAHLYTPEAMMRAGKAGVKSFEHAHMMDEEAARMIVSNGIFVAPMPQFNKPRNEKNVVFDKKKAAKAELVRARENTATELINKYNIPILFGSDLMIFKPDYELPEGGDLSIYKKRFGSFKALLSTTGYANDIIKLTTYQNPYSDGKIGVLCEGSYADILLVDGNPVEDVDILTDESNIRFIMKDGRVYKNTLTV